MVDVEHLRDFLRVDFHLPIVSAFRAQIVFGTLVPGALFPVHHDNALVFLCIVPEEVFLGGVGNGQPRPSIHGSRIPRVRVVWLDDHAVAFWFPLLGSLVYESHRRIFRRDLFDGMPFVAHVIGFFSDRCRPADLVRLGEDPEVPHPGRQSGRVAHAGSPEEQLVVKARLGSVRFDLLAQLQEVFVQCRQLGFQKFVVQVDVFLQEL
mmetsp:Transcript_8874/g.21688  ORF Transcript_8874/g.21688 Transcript_8874/m.21688 type:complete len:207 (-) Transcript_8874:741-1361(-)